MKGMFADYFQVLNTLSALAELGTLVILIGLAALFARGLRRQPVSDTRVNGLRQLAFPLLGILFCSVLRFVAHHNGWHLHFTGIVVQLLWAMAGIRIVVFAVQRVFPNAVWMRSFGRVIAVIVWFGVALDFLGILPDLVDWLDSFVLPMGRTHLSVWTILQGLAAVLGSVIVALWVGGVIETRMLQKTDMDSSVRVVLTRVTKALLVLVAILVGMELVGLDITTLSVFGGAVGVGLGFGMQKIASNYVSGFIILLDRSIRIGNLIQVGGDRGQVLQITTRYTVLRGGNGSHFIVPNETLVSNTVQNDSFADLRQRGAVRVQVAYNADVESALAILEEIAGEQPRVISDPAPKAFLVSLDDSGMTLEISFWIADPGNGFLEINSSINRGIVRRFREEEIEIPFPQREVRLLNQPAA